MLIHIVYLFCYISCNIYYSYLIFFLSNSTGICTISRFVSIDCFAFSDMSQIFTHALSLVWKRFCTISEGPLEKVNGWMQTDCEAGDLQDSKPLHELSCRYLKLINIWLISSYSFNARFLSLAASLRSNVAQGLLIHF